MGTKRRTSNQEPNSKSSDKTLTANWPVAMLSRHRWELQRTAWLIPPRQNLWTSVGFKITNLLFCLELFQILFAQWECN
jgi:hypothetical protein